MGVGSSTKKYLTESDLESDTESDSECDMTSEEIREAPLDYYEISEIATLNSMINERPDSNDRTDAALSTLPTPEDVITLEKVQAIESELDKYEIVSLVYLLYDSTELALQDLEILVTTGKKSNLLYKWAKSEEYRECEWKEKLIEALSIIQNYKILKNAGYTKEDLQSKYMPYRSETSCFVNKTRKALYLIAEKLTNEQTAQLINNMGKKLQGREARTRNAIEDYLELYFLYWEQTHLSFDGLKNIFKIMDLERQYDILNYVLPPQPQETNLVSDIRLTTESPNMMKKNSKSKVRRKSTTRDTTYSQPKSLEVSLTQQSEMSGVSQEGSSEDINRYPINPKNPGVVLIINQEEFYTEPDKAYKHLLHKDNDRIQLERRDGTIIDKSNLKRVFGKRGFKVIVRENLAHYDIISVVKDVVKEIRDESSLIVCILSHGDNGVVYGANSCKVSVDEVQSIMCKKNKNLQGKPKILILQSCQGRQCQRIEEESSEDEGAANTKDGPAPSTADLLTFWATIPGFAAIRNRNHGSWLIQELCHEIEQASLGLHFLDICTRVVNKVTNKEWKEKTAINIMTPMVVTTLRKSFYLPAPCS